MDQEEILINEHLTKNPCECGGSWKIYGVNYSYPLQYTFSCTQCKASGSIRNANGGIRIIGEGGIETIREPKLEMTVRR